MARLTAATWRVCHEESSRAIAKSLCVARACSARAIPSARHAHTRTPSEVWSRETTSAFTAVRSSALHRDAPGEARLWLRSPLPLSSPMSVRRARIRPIASAAAATSARSAPDSRATRESTANPFPRRPTGFARHRSGRDSTAARRSCVHVRVSTLTQGPTDKPCLPLAACALPVTHVEGLTWWIVHLTHLDGGGDRILNPVHYAIT